MSPYGPPPSKKFRPDTGSTNFPKNQSFSPKFPSFKLGQKTSIKTENNISGFNNNGNSTNLNSNGNQPNNFTNGLNFKLKRDKEALPIFSVRDSLMDYLKKNETVILVSETGSGKTTQVPQFLYETGMLKRGSVIVTQPRRVAAITIAGRVAQEMNTELGQLVGYSVRFDSVVSDKTKIKYATDGMMLREAMLDPCLKRYAWVILDEVHERTINTDILFGVVKKAQRERKKDGKPPLCVIVMSATLDATKFSEFFDNCPKLNAPGRGYNLRAFFMRPDPRKESYVFSCIRATMDVHRKKPVDEGILVFLTGQEEIDKVCECLNKMIKRLDPKKYAPIKVSRLYASLPQHIQMEAFKPPQMGVRHIICCTNIAETSVTIPGIRHVIDSGRAKIRTFNPTSGFDELKVCRISKAQAWQRAGRAGREGDGTCLQMYLRTEWNDDMPDQPQPEINRASLTTVVLQLFAVGISDVSKFDFLDRPKDSYLRSAVEDLLNLEAVSRSEDGQLQLTELGQKMTKFPLEPKYSKILLMGPKYGCTQEVLTIVAMLSGEQVLTIPTGATRSVAHKCHQRLASVQGDHLTLLNIYRQFKRSKKNKSWCTENFLNYRNLIHAVEIRKQLSEISLKLGLEMSTAVDDTHSVRKCLLTGLFSQISELQPGLKYRTISSREECKIHPSSVLFETRSPYLVYTELINTGSTFMHNVSLVMAEWLYEAAPDYFRQRHVKSEASLVHK